MARTRAIGTSTAALLVRQWRKPGLWADKTSRAALLVAAGQAQAAGLADSYAVAHLGGSDHQLEARAFAGVASDGRPLDSLLVGAAVVAGRKADAVEAARAAEAWLALVAVTQVADAARAALRSGMAVRDASGVRVASAPCCGRCAVLNGRVYSWRADFDRHPGCDCTYLPSRRGETPDVPDIQPAQIRGLSASDRRAIELGADPVSVINAQRGMYAADVFGRQVKATFDSTARRTSAFPRRSTPNSPRLRPESILREAKDDADAIRLLRRFGYLR